MTPAERRKKIIELIDNSGGALSINELVNLLNVSHMTIRRDLRLLEKQNLVSSMSAGVLISKKIHSEPSHTAKEIMNAPQKDSIGKAASELITPNSCIYLDAGTASLALARHIYDRDDLTIVTNDFEVVNYLVDKTKSALIHVGGQIRKDNRSSVGPLATKIIKSLSIDIAFLSASSWDTENVTTPDIEKVMVKQVVIESSIHKILISDSSKFAKVATFKAFSLDFIDKIITDKGLPVQAQKALERKEIDLILV